MISTTLTTSVMRLIGTEFIKSTLLLLNGTATFYKDLSVDSWYKSMKNTVATGIKAESEAPADPKMAKFNKMIHPVCGKGKILNPTNFPDEEVTKKVFLEHNEEVKRHVPVDRLSVLKPGERWNRLCAFLGKDVLDISYPNANSAEEFIKHLEENKEQLGNLNKN